MQVGCSRGVKVGAPVLNFVLQGEDGAVAGAVLAAAHRSNTPNRSSSSSANGSSGGVKPSTPQPQAAHTPAATRREPAAVNRRLPAAPTGKQCRGLCQRYCLVANFKTVIVASDFASN